MGVVGESGRVRNAISRWLINRNCTCLHTCAFVICSSTPLRNKAKEVPNVGLDDVGKDEEGAVDVGEEEGRGEDMGEEVGGSGEEGEEGRGGDMGEEVGGSEE